MNFYTIIDQSRVELDTNLRNNTKTNNELSTELRILKNDHVDNVEMPQHQTTKFIENFICHLDATGGHIDFDEIEREYFPLRTCNLYDVGFMQRLSNFLVSKKKIMEKTYKYP
jgi:hypothetical protein